MLKHERRPLKIFSRVQFSAIQKFACDNAAGSIFRIILIAANDKRGVQRRFISGLKAWKRWSRSRRSAISVMGC